MIVFFTTGRLENREKAFDVELVGDHLPLNGETEELLNVHASVFVTFGLVQLRELELLSLPQRYTVLGHLVNQLSKSTLIIKYAVFVTYNIL